MKVYVIIINTLINTKNKFQYLKLIFIFFTFSNIFNIFFYFMRSLPWLIIKYTTKFTLLMYLFICLKKQYERLSNHFILQNKKTARKMFKNKKLYLNKRNYVNFLSEKTM